MRLGFFLAAGAKALPGQALHQCRDLLGLGTEFDTIVITVPVAGPVELALVQASGA